MLLDELVLLIEKCYKSGAIVTAVAFRSENKLPPLELVELRALKENLESLPNERGS